MVPTLQLAPAGVTPPSLSPMGGARSSRSLPPAPQPRCHSPPEALEASATTKTSLVPQGAAGEAAGPAPAGCIPQGPKSPVIVLLLLKNQWFAMRWLGRDGDG